MTAGLARRLASEIERVESIKPGGVVVRVVGLIIEARGPQAPVGDVCIVRTRREFKTFGAVGKGEVLAEVVGFRDGKTMLMPIGEMIGVAPGDPVVALGHPLEAPVGHELLGRVVDGLGKPIDGGADLSGAARRSVFREPADPVRRPRIEQILPLGIRAIDGLLTVGRGQRVGIFSGSGVGKSTVLGMMARYTAADVSVVALIGERGREVRDFIESSLGPEGLAKSVVIVATSDQPPLLRARAAYLATTIAEYFRDQNRDVLLLMDSVTRFCRALREIGLSIGEPPGTRSFTPSVFSILPKLLERAGTSERGSITGLYTVLVDEDDMNEPVADNVRGILDGHIVLSRDLAHRNHYPAIDVLQSISRLMIEITERDQVEAAGKIKELIAVYRDAEDLIRIGAYADGSDPQIDEAKRRMQKINAFLRQRTDEKCSYESARKGLLEVIS